METSTNLRSFAPLILWCSMLLWNHANPSRTWLWNAKEVDKLVGSLAGKINLVPGWFFFLPLFYWFFLRARIHGLKKKPIKRRLFREKKAKAQRQEQKTKDCSVFLCLHERVFSLEKNFVVFFLSLFPNEKNFFLEKNLFLMCAYAAQELGTCFFWTSSTKNSRKEKIQENFKDKTKMERWLSGRKRLIANPLYEIPSYRGFESLSLRNTRLFCLLHFLL